MQTTGRSILMAKRPVPKKLAKKLAQIRAKLGLSQTEIVKALNYKASPLRPAQISQFETGRREPPLMLLLAYARLAGISTDALIDDRVNISDLE
jgi:transcriptional regulator with XRE-family HTH domain